MSRLIPQPPPSRDDSQEFSEEEAFTDELIERILENYTFKCEPEIRLKLRHRLPDLALCACYSKPWTGEPRWRFTAKPAPPKRVSSDDASSSSSSGSNRSALVSRYVRSALVVPEMGQAALFSAKIPISVFRLQFVLGYNWKTETPSLDYRLTTKWGDGPRLKRKERVQISEAFKLRAKWNLEAHFPDLEGHLGSGGNRGTAVDVDYGGVSFEVTQLDGVLDL